MEELARVPRVPFCERAPKLHDYYTQCIVRTLEMLDDVSQVATLRRAADPQRFLLQQPEHRHGPRQPIELHLDTSGAPIAIENVRGERDSALRSLKPEGLRG
jgi:hypothetical protein